MDNGNLFENARRHVLVCDFDNEEFQHELLVAGLVQNLVGSGYAVTLVQTPKAARYFVENFPDLANKIKIRRSLAPVRSAYGAISTIGNLVNIFSFSFRSDYQKIVFTNATPSLIVAFRLLRGKKKLTPASMIFNGVLLNLGGKDEVTDPAFRLAKGFIPVFKLSRFIFNLKFVMRLESLVSDGPSFIILTKEAHSRIIDKFPALEARLEFGPMVPYKEPISKFQRHPKNRSILILGRFNRDYMENVAKSFSSYEFHALRPLPRLAKNSNIIYLGHHPSRNEIREWAKKTDLLWFGRPFIPVGLAHSGVMFEPLSLGKQMVIPHDIDYEGWGLPNDNFVSILSLDEEYGHHEAGEDENNNEGMRPSHASYLQLRALGLR